MFALLVGLFGKGEQPLMVKWWFKFIRPTLTECIPLFQMLYGSDERQSTVYSVHQHKNEPMTDFTIEFELINLFDRCHCPTKCTSNFLLFCRAFWFQEHFIGKSDLLSLDLYRYSWAAHSRASNTQSDTHHEHTLKFFINLFYSFYSPLFSLYSSYWHIHIQTITPAQSVGFLLDTQLSRRFQFMHLFTHFFINSKII